MEKEFSPIECQKIMDLLTSKHYDESISMFQMKECKHILIVQTISLGTSDFKAMHDMKLSITIFAEGNKVEMWMQKY